MAYPTNAIGYRHYDVKSVFGLGHVWDVNTLDWVPMEQPLLEAGNVTIPGTVTVTGSVSLTPTARTASSPAAASVGTSSAQAVASNGSRKGLVLVNTSSNDISIAFGATAVLNSGITLLAGGGAFTMTEFNFTTAAVNAIAGGASSNLAIQEYT